MGHGDWIETCGIFLAILLATLVSTYSEYSNENAFQKLQEEASRIRCKVWRDGEPVEIHIDDIVVGDAVILEAGDIVILDDNFLSIKKAILYGRTIYNSICKFIVFQLTINFSAVAINFIAPFVGGRILRTAPLNLEEWLVVIALALSMVLVDLVRKLLWK